MLKFVLEVLFLLCRALNMLRCVLLPAAPGLCMATSGAQASFFLVFSPISFWKQRRPGR